MTGSHNDLGARCYRHSGHVFLPRCDACLSLNREYQALHLNPETINAS